MVKTPEELQNLTKDELIQFVLSQRRKTQETNTCTPRTKCKGKAL